ncbi:hypothetical protein E0L36_26715 [Streptomyces sp. AJS327]|uniref:hypothetical protein n=1 Tax=Streptomyces sp. AJS327 TaxID=2545265 RepID=UPI0015E03611|nr:hypothetical protein [Streptomyces sp. AJS327]MBA0054313.1 hypothetical protein [Streptomyces sp. AJS327]
MERFLTFVLASLLVLGVLSTQSALVMVLIGWWHDIRPAVPPIGFVESFILVGISQFVVPTRTRTA